MFFKGNIKLQKSFRVATGYLALIFATLYFTPIATGYLERIKLLEIVIDGAYVAAALTLFVLFFYKYRIYRFKPYLLFFLLWTVFFVEFWNTRFMVERFHYLEYGFLFALWFRVVRHLAGRSRSYLLTFFLCSFFGILEEGTQYFLPNRNFDWFDMRMNVVGTFFGMAMVMIFSRYRRDKAAEIEETAVA